MGYGEIPFWLATVFLLGGMAALAWSSDVFVDGSAALAKLLGIPPFIIGMVVIGFGTSAPELCVSTMSGLSGHANLSLGNAYGSCVFNIAVILGVAALVMPLAIRPSVALVSSLGLAGVSLFSLWVLRDGVCSRTEATALLAMFAVVMPLYCWLDRKTGMGKKEPPKDDGAAAPRPSAAVLKVVVGLVVLIGSSHVLVWGAVDFARAVGVSDLLIGLTIVAVGTSLPELASAIASARRGENEFVLGNIVGSNLFNTLAVVGIATAIQPLSPGADGTPAFSPYILSRDLPFVTALSLSILFFGMNWRHLSRPGTAGRVKAAVWLLSFAAYFAIMLAQEI